MSTTSHKSRTRILSEAAMKKRVHTSREDRDLTVDGLDKHHHEANAVKALQKAATVKRTTIAHTTSQMNQNRSAHQVS